MMVLAERIVEFMRTTAYKPLTADDLAEEMNLQGDELGQLWSVLSQLEQSAAIIKTRSGKYGVPDRMNLVVGKLSLNAKGFGFVIPEQRKNPEEKDVYIPPDGMMSAMHNDRVVARLHGESQHGRAREGEIIRIVERANPRIVGVYEASRGFGFVTPDDRRLGQDVFIPKRGKEKIKDGSKVVVEIIKWPEKKRSAEGQIVEVLGAKGDMGIAILSIIKGHNLPTEFPPAVEAAADKVPAVISGEELTGRRDLRHLPIITIDGEDAKDLDDAVHVVQLENGNLVLGVHIADVSYYVKENSVLDKEALERATSVYLADRVIPMLPPRLSNGICSLNAGEDRLTLSAQMEFDGQGRVVNYHIYPSVIKVAQRFSYTIVRKILVDKDEALQQEFAKFVPDLKLMEKLCGILRQRRMRRGAIDFDFPELKVKLDDSGKPVDIVKRTRSLAESIIEEFMLAANETVAEHVYNLKLPFVYRIHEEPDNEKMVKLNNLLLNFDQSLPLGKVEKIPPAALQKVLAKIAGRPEERIISTVMLRSLKQARYEPQSVGHFGLAAAYYTHFTSPIRRYPDLIVHRILRETFQGTMPEKRRTQWTSRLPEITLHSSEQERAAVEAERDTVALKVAEYMEQFVGETFSGIINGVTAFGLFVELENGVEGLVRVSSMEDDYYHYREEQYSLVGERTRKVYQLGNAVEVILIRVNTEERAIDFVLADNNAWPGFSSDSSPAGKSGKGSKPGKGKSGEKTGGKSRSKSDKLPKGKLIADVDKSGKDSGKSGKSKKTGKSPAGRKGSGKTGSGRGLGSRSETSAGGGKTGSAPSGRSGGKTRSKQGGASSGGAGKKASATAGKTSRRSRSSTPKAD